MPAVRLEQLAERRRQPRYLPRLVPEQALVRLAANSFARFIFVNKYKNAYPVTSSPPGCARQCLGYRPGRPPNREDPAQGREVANRPDSGGPPRKMCRALRNAM